ncbi:hypothetical protein BXZ70DRAFT_507454 [Cristinia sonorae]|uniref:C2H2-type domain-containing protein n=1 Tax=Cristinia sonorae TaxID=1940300 RepID=A0A8K0XTR4_9AGAR|nr:hypothetical protein BXZ70DRAFT_507454 [Cristinia sonorae]
MAFSQSCNTSCRGIEDYRDATIDATPICFNFQPSPFCICNGNGRPSSFVGQRSPYVCQLCFRPFQDVGPLNRHVRKCASALTITQAAQTRVDLRQSELDSMGSLRKKYNTPQRARQAPYRPASGWPWRSLLPFLARQRICHPSTASGGSCRWSSGLSKARAVSYNIDVINGNFIAFTAIAVHFALSSQKEMDHGNASANLDDAVRCGIWPYGKLFVTIIDFINDHLYDAERNELMLWYSQMVSAP